MRKPSTTRKVDSAAANGKTKRKPVEQAPNIEEPQDQPPPRHPGGRPPKYKPEYAEQAKKLCALGATDAELADFFEVKVVTIWRWQTTNKEFCNALNAGKKSLDDRVQRSLFQRAVGYTHDAVKIFMPAGAEKPVYADYREHVPPDPGAAKLWLCNRRPSEWRDKQNLEHTGQDGGPIKTEVVFSIVDGEA